MTAPRALVVEDDRSWQEILSELLTDAGLEVDLAADLPAALALITAYSHRIAVVDLSLSPDHRNQDGLRVLESLRQHDPACLPLLLTGFATVELAVSVLTSHGAFTCLQKEQFQRSQFRQVMQQALASPRPHLTAPASMPVEPAQPAPLIPPAGQALVVEDDAGWRSIFSELLADAGYQVRLCASFGEALGSLRRARFDLAVVDLSLEGEEGLSPRRPASAEHLDGYRLLASTRLAGIPTIVVSGVVAAAEIEKAYREEGIFAFLQKQSFDRRAFQNTITEARAQPPHAGLETLTPREREVLHLLSQGLTNKEIADALVISANTVKRHIKAIYRKLDLHTRSAAAVKARA